MINLDDWAKIRHLHSMGLHSKREIARLAGVSRGTVDRALESGRPPAYQRAPAGSRFDAFEPRVRVLLATTAGMPASTLAERVGWSGSSSVFRQKVSMIRPEYLPPDPADRIDHQPGVQVQCDLWFPHQPIPLGHDQYGSPPVLVMTSTFSGNIQALMLPSR
ncbi:IS21 family transposase, partial [Subtercola boreus]